MKKIILIAALVLACVVITLLFLGGKEKDVYTVSFNTNGAAKVASQELDYGSKVVKPMNPTKDGYKFLGWYLNGEKFNFDTVIEADITLEAMWEKIVVEDEEDKKEDKEEVVDKEEEKAEQSDNPGNNQNSNQNQNQTPTVKKYTITFNTDGGSAVQSQTVETGKKATKPTDPTRAGYTFKGWFVGETEYDFSTAVTKNVTVKAKWEKEPIVSWETETVEGSFIKQVRIFVKLDTTRVAGTVDITYIDGTTITREVPVSGYLEVESAYTKISNPKVK